MIQDKHKTIAVNNPGGPPRQFCVQFRENARTIWKRSAVFLDQDAAKNYCLELQNQGLESRLIHYRLPTAA